MRFLSLFLLVFSACTLNAGNFAGKLCDTNNDCPEPYVCAQARPNSRTCELLRGVNGPVGPGPVVPDYCEVAPLLLATCVRNCHGADHTGSPTYPDFRFDLYSSPPDGGAKEQALAIQRRIQADTMPPFNPSNVPLTAGQKALIYAWVEGGAPAVNPNCDIDAGVKAVDFCNDVKPILKQSCGNECHGSGKTWESYFKSDIYSDGSLGAKDLAARLLDRVNQPANNAMPPNYAMPSSMLSTGDRQKINRWIDAGTPECFGQVDAGSGDGGSPDGGRADGGSADGG